MNEETLDRHLCARLEEFGITRVADTTGLDRIDVPTCSCVRPGTTDGIWVYSGKGSSFAEARVSAIMECIERTCALWNASLVVRNLPQGVEAWPRDRFTERYDGRPTTAWVRGENLRSGKDVWLPASLAFGGYPPHAIVADAAGVVTSNGLGAGITKEAAVVRGLAELIERDVVSCAELRASHYGASFLAAIAAAFGLQEQSLEGYRDDMSVAVDIDAETLPASAHELYLRMRKAGLDVQVKWIPNDFGVPVFGAAAVELMWGSVLAAAGYAAAIDPVEAVRKALLELAQSRATDRQGAREDSFEPEKARLHATPQHHWLASPGEQSIAFDELLATRLDGEPIQALLGALDEAGLPDAAAISFPAFPGLHVVRVMVPEIETWHPTGGRSRLGMRMRNRFAPAKHHRR